MDDPTHSPSTSNWKAALVSSEPDTTRIKDSIEDQVPGLKLEMVALVPELTE